MAESLRRQSVEQFEKWRNLNKAVNLQNIELQKMPKKMFVLHQEFEDEQNNCQRLLEMLVKEINKQKETLRNVKKEIALSRKRLNRIKNERKKLVKHSK